VVYSYSPRPKDILNLNSVTREELRQGMLGVVNSRNGTAGSAAVNGVKVAGKTGTAQWGPKSKERTAAWFAGFAPADNPQFAYAALYEGAPGEYAHGGSKAAPMIGDLLRVLFKDQAKNAEKKKTDENEEQQDDEDGQMDQSN
jgi:penicillin-binding protein 2